MPEWIAGYPSKPSPQIKVSRRMASPWLNLPLSDYEGHMSSPNVGQATLLADVLSNALKEFHPASVAMIGCAGGNGFDRIDPLETTRVVGVDINRSYLEIASTRYTERFKKLDLHCSDISQNRLGIEPVELIYAALIFEYVNVPLALQHLSLACRDGGHLVSLLQLPFSGGASVTPTAFTSLQRLGPVLNYVDPLALRDIAHETGFRVQRSEKVTSTAGKEFMVQTFSRSSANKSSFMGSDTIKNPDETMISGIKSSSPDIPTARATIS